MYHLFSLFCRSVVSADRFPLSNLCFHIEMTAVSQRNAVFCKTRRSFVQSSMQTNLQQSPAEMIRIPVVIRLFQHGAVVDDHG